MYVCFRLCRTVWLEKWVTWRILFFPPKSHPSNRDPSFYVDASFCCQKERKRASKKVSYSRNEHTRRPQKKEAAHPAFARDPEIRNVGPQKSWAITLPPPTLFPLVRREKENTAAEFFFLVSHNFLPPFLKKREELNSNLVLFLLFLVLWEFAPSFVLFLLPPSQSQANKFAGEAASGSLLV